MLNNAEGRKGNEDLSKLKMAAEESEKEMQSLKVTLDMKMNEAQQNDKKVEELNSTLDVMKKELDSKTKELEDAKNDLNELNKLVEEKSQEADESVGKYCALMIEVHKLEEANSALSARLEQVSHKPPSQSSTHPNTTEGLRRSSRKSSSKLMTDNSENIPCTPQRSPMGTAKRGRCEVTDKDSAQEALHNLTKKIKATATTTPKPQAEDEDFRPEGLPELVQKGFADIPLGEASPFIVRRTTVRRCSPRLMSKQISTTSETEKVLEPLHLQSPSANSPTNGSNSKCLSQITKNQKITEAQGENCHVQ